MPHMGANQWAAKVLQLRMKGKHDEAEKLRVTIVFFGAIVLTSLYLPLLLCYGFIQLWIVSLVARRMLCDTC